MLTFCITSLFSLADSIWDMVKQFHKEDTKH